MITCQKNFHVIESNPYNTVIAPATWSPLTNNGIINAPHHCALLNFIMKRRFALHVMPSLHRHCRSNMVRPFPSHYGGRWPLRERACNLDIDELKRNATDALPLLIQSILPLISQPKEMRAVGLPTTNHREKSHSQILGEGRICHWNLNWRLACFVVKHLQNTWAYTAVVRFPVRLY